MSEANKPLEDWMLPLLQNELFLSYPLFIQLEEYTHDLEAQRLNAGLPPYASALLIELHKLPENDDPVIEFCSVIQLIYTMNLGLIVTLLYQVTLLLAQLPSQNTLKFAQVIFRHGERNPRHTYGNYTQNLLKFWPEGLEKLTDTGKNQAYELGQFLRKRYVGFVSPSYKGDEISIFRKYDNFLSLDASCPRRVDLRGTPWRTFFEQRFFKNEPEILEYVFRESGQTGLFENPPNSTNIHEQYYAVQEVINCLSIANKPLENWMLPLLKNKLFLSYPFFLQLEEYTMDLEAQRLNAGSLVQWMPLQTRLPSYASALLIELHKLPENDDPVIEFWFRQDHL
ncbi:unnamed protein product [Allacma fusca]|uniref:acid phosphatase n=1 Tax=Allacma fusca TaxID=39272 RepID=A0A8J2KMB1_9HEXA|nr:unnamed protein product [Allacma fusca]